MLPVGPLTSGPPYCGPEGLMGAALKVGEGPKGEAAVLIGGALMVGLGPKGEAAMLVGAALLTGGALMVG
jgi:hypothetical protein